MEIILKLLQECIQDLLRRVYRYVENIAHLTTPNIGRLRLINISYLVLFMEDFFTRETPNDSLWTLWSPGQLPLRLLVNNTIQNQTNSVPA